MSEQELFVLAEQTLRNVVEQIKLEQWGMKPGPQLTYGRDYDLKGVVNQLAYDSAWVPDVLAGKTIEEVGDKYDGDLLGEHPKESYAAITAKSEEVVRGFTEPDMTVRVSYGNISAREYLQHITFYRAISAWAIARFIGVDETLPRELIDGLWDIVIPNIDTWKKMGVIKDEMPAPEDADRQAQLLSKIGYWEEKPKN